MPAQHRRLGLDLCPNWAGTCTATSCPNGFPPPHCFQKAFFPPSSSDTPDRAPAFWASGQASLWLVSLHNPKHHPRSLLLSGPPHLSLIPFILEFLTSVTHLSFLSSHRSSWTFWFTFYLLLLQSQSASHCASSSSPRDTSARLATSHITRLLRHRVLRLSCCLRSRALCCRRNSCGIFPILIHLFRKCQRCLFAVHPLELHRCSRIVCTFSLPSEGNGCFQTFQFKVGVCDGTAYCKAPRRTQATLPNSLVPAVFWSSAKHTKTSLFWPGLRSHAICFTQYYVQRFYSRARTAPNKRVIVTKGSMPNRLGPTALTSRITGDVPTQYADWL